MLAASFNNLGSAKVSLSKELQVGLKCVMVREVGCIYQGLRTISILRHDTIAERVGAKLHYLARPSRQRFLRRPYQRPLRLGTSEATYTGRGESETWHAIKPQMRCRMSTGTTDNELLYGVGLLWSRNEVDACAPPLGKA